MIFFTDFQSKNTFGPENLKFWKAFGPKISNFKKLLDQKKKGSFLVTSGQRNLDF
jgi:hypothetical protein